MYRLLPQEYVDKLRKQYRLRLVTVFLWFFAIMIIIGAISLFPSYLLLNTQTKDVESRLAEQVKVTKQDDTKDVDTKLAQTSELLKSFDLTGKKLQPSAFVQLIVKYKIPGISISTIEISKKAPGIVSIVVAGDATTREVLSTFRKNIQKDSQIATVILPDSDLAKSKDIRFSMSITTK